MSCKAYVRIANSESIDHARLRISAILPSLVLHYDRAATPWYYLPGMTDLCVFIVVHAKSLVKSSGALVWSTTILTTKSLSRYEMLVAIRTDALLFVNPAILYTSLPSAKKASLANDACITRYNYFLCPQTASGQPGPRRSYHLS